MERFKKILLSVLMQIVALNLLIFSATITVKSQPRELIWPQRVPFSKVSWRNKVYLFQQFQPGQIIFDTGFESPQIHLLNYNLFTERMSEITAKGDTVLLDMVEVPHDIRLGGYTFQFLPKKGYMRLLNHGKVSLATLDYFSSGYLASSSNGMTSDTRRVPLGVDNRKQDSDLNRSYMQKGDLYLLTDKQYYHVSKNNLLNAYEEKRGIVKSYLEDHEIDYFNADSLIHLTNFLNKYYDEPKNIISGSFVVKAGETIGKHWRDSLYALLQFSEADMKSSQNSASKSLSMNYNLLSGRMDYVNLNGDTLQFKNNDMPVINLDGRFFYRQADGGYAEMLVQGKGSLFEIRRLKLLQEDKNPGVPEASARPSVYTRNISGDRLYVVGSTYFFLDQFQHSWPVNKATFIRFFPNSKKKIDEYLGTHPVDFQNKHDLIRLLSFCQQF